MLPNSENGPQGLSIPYLEPDIDNLSAALAYAQRGWFIAPVKKGTKNPGSILGREWQNRSSRDPDEIAAWYAAADHDVALHVGRSGAVVVDVDHPDLVPEEITAELYGGDGHPIQATRSDDSGRCHHVYAMPPGRSIGNSASGLPGCDVRGSNGIIVVTPSSHPHPDGRYAWIQTGAVPPLPARLAGLLADARTHADVGEPQTITEFCDEHDRGDDHSALEGLRSMWTAKTSGGTVRRHEGLNSLAITAVQEARSGLYPARTAFDLLWEMFSAAVIADGSRTEQQAREEFRRSVHGAIGREWGNPYEVDASEILAGVTNVPAADETAEFWESTESLRHVRDFARARRVGPWAMLGVCLTRAVVVTPPRVTLPPLVGGRASLNLFVALVGPSGSGKGAAERAAEDAFCWGTDVYTTGVGSGEGINHAFVTWDRQAKECVPLRDSVLFSVPEVDRLAGLTNRAGNTLESSLRMSWSGESLGMSYAAPEKNLTVPAHSYRLSLVVGVQPERARALLVDGAEGGTAQRFLWMPVTDPDAPAQAPPQPPLPDHRVAQALWPAEGIQIPESVRAELDADRLDRLRGGTGRSELDGHAGLQRLKITAALCILDGRRTPLESDWQAAGIVLRVSNSTREQIAATLAEVDRAANESAGRAQGHRESVAQSVVAERAVERVASVLVRKLTAKGEPMTPGALRRALTSSDRKLFSDALAFAVDGGFLTADGEVISMA